MIARAAVLFMAAYAVTMITVLALMRLPEIPLLRYVALAIPVLSSLTVVGYWLEQGAPWPSLSVPRRLAPRGTQRIIPRTEPARSRAG